MPKHTQNNTRIKRQYLVWLADAKGFSEASIDKAASAISSYEAFLDGKDFRTLHAERARSFKRKLSKQTNAKTGAPLSASTVGSTLREIKAFFHWLADQPGYKSKISHSDADYFSPDRRTEAARRSNLWKPHPSPEQVRRLLGLMPSETVLNRRDRAFVAFLFLTGSREGAAISLRLSHVDLPNKCVHFDGKEVNTKFAKSFTTSFFPIGEDVEQIVRDWVSELRNDHLFSDADPLFPKTKVGTGKSRKFEAVGIARKPWASPSSAANVFKKAFKDAGLPPFSPHRVRDTIAELAKDFCRSPEDYKAWSQNMGHEDVLTTLRSYGSVAPGRQMEVMAKFRNRGPTEDHDDFKVI